MPSTCLGPKLYRLGRLFPPASDGDIQLSTGPSFSSSGNLDISIFFHGPIALPTSQCFSPTNLLINGITISSDKWPTYVSSFILSARSYLASSVTSAYMFLK